MLSTTTLHSLPPPPSSSKKPLLPPLPNPHLFSHPSSLLLELCSNPTELRRLLPAVIKHGLFFEHVLQTKLVSLFSRFGALREASLVFSDVADRSDELHHSLLKGHCHHSPLPLSLSFFLSMRRADVRTSVHNFTYLLKACADASDLPRGREIHSLLVSSGFSSNVFAMTAVVNMYAKCRRIEDARKMFDRMPVRDLVAWNAVVSGYAQNGLAADALAMVGRMQEDGIRPDSITLVSALPACADARRLEVAKSVHAFAVRAGVDGLVNVSTALVDCYCKCGAVGTARKVFDRLRGKNAVSWNSMIDGYARSGDAEEAMRLFDRMSGAGVEATEVTVLALLSACAELGDLEEGRKVHRLLLSIGLESNVSVMNALITMYSKCKRPDLAAEVFDSLQSKTVVTWNAMISGFSQNGRADEALKSFYEMRRRNVNPDSFTFVSVIPAIADISVVRRAKWIHGYAVRSCFDRNIFVATALVDLYAKCGGVGLARKLFDSLDERHVTTWNAMIDGYGTHGYAETAIELFEEMKRSPAEPNDVTFLCVLSACAHSGLVEEGKRQFESMRKDYGIEPVMDHYGTMVDLLGRAGLLDKAWDFIERMPIEPGISVYGAMLGACRIHKNVKLGEEAARRLFELEPEEGGYHVALANIYANASMWDDVARVRKLMEATGLQKTPGCSFFELGNKVHTFYSGSTNHPHSKQIYARLDTLLDEIRAIGYVPDTEPIHDVESDVKEQLLAAHSEKLAIAFALINTRPGATIQIKKNLRVCRDCHAATKFISRATGREIIVRDMQRFHHFKDGLCSCGDYW
ncbi:pentatricopeptide repeat-containing protein, chloroplastic [Iris pallida]|uniref:Pentatricopeptide repeat-containing protein, chloroplastic n=1 Tax=Iris pallida TaxID=29817 RepID=A0AAX6EYR9_IRIPA|nr:pentatricopeptide repeat-containing protein, chloroplastic [Iris pallida]